MVLFNTIGLLKVEFNMKFLPLKKLLVFWQPSSQTLSDDYDKIYVNIPKIKELVN